MRNDSSIWSEKSLKNAIEKSISISETLRRLGLTPQGNFRTFHKYVKKYKIDTSHFLGRSHLAGKKRNLKKIGLDKILVKDSFYSIKNLKQRLIDDGYFSYECNCCKISKWMDKEIKLQLDHINGDRFDNRIENLRLLCPNCHSQTDTFCKKNISKKKKIPKYKKCICGNNMLYSSTLCRSCAAVKNAKNKPTKINWPRIEWLISRINEVGFKQTGRELGVSDNAVRKRIKKFRQ